MKLLEQQIQLTDSSGGKPGHLGMQASSRNGRLVWCSLAGMNGYYIPPIFNFCLTQRKCKKPQSDLAFNHVLAIQTWNLLSQLPIVLLLKYHTLSNPEASEAWDKMC